MDIVPLAIPDLKLVCSKRSGDARGWFMETYRRDRMANAGISDEFVQDNQSFSAARGTLRGLHLQKPPRAQAKLIRVLSGRIFDVALDLRRSSRTYGRHVAIELDAEDGVSLYIPVGFAHGFCTLEPDTEVLYKVTNYYAAVHDHGLAWDDPDLGIVWPVSPANAILSDKDRRHGGLGDLPPFFD